jgi:hypothetical protein
MRTTTAFTSFLSVVAASIPACLRALVRKLEACGYKDRRRLDLLEDDDVSLDDDLEGADTAGKERNLYFRLRLSNNAFLET